MEAGVDAAEVAKVAGAVGGPEAGYVYGGASLGEWRHAGEGIPNSLGICVQAERHGTLEQNRECVKSCVADVVAGADGEEFCGEDGARNPARFPGAPSDEGAVAVFVCDEDDLAGLAAVVGVVGERVVGVNAHLQGVYVEREVHEAKLGGGHSEEAGIEVGEVILGGLVGEDLGQNFHGVRAIGKGVCAGVRHLASDGSEGCWCSRGGRLRQGMDVAGLVHYVGTTGCARKFRPVELRVGGADKSAAFCREGD